MPNDKEQLLPLTSIRFFLALWVVVFHQTDTFGYLAEWLLALPEPAVSFFKTGYVAVSVFFVLSGFILAYNYSLLRSWSSAELRRFAVSRFARIYPVYCVGLVLVAPLVIRTARNTAPDASLGSLLGSAAVHSLLLQSWVPQIALSWNAPGWSLSDEAFFYLCFPFIGVALWSASRLRSVLLLAVAVWVTASIAPLVAVALPLNGFGNVPATSSLPDAEILWANLVKFNPLIRLPEFCGGVLAARIFQMLRASGNPLSQAGYLLYVPALLLEAAALAFADAIPYPLIHNGLLLPLHAMAIIGLALGGGILPRILSWPPLVFLGGASYSMYILHAPVAMWIDFIAERYFHVHIVGFNFAAMYVFLVVCLAGFVFTVIEEPANRFWRKRLC